MPDENKPDSSLDEEQQAVNSATENADDANAESQEASDAAQAEAADDSGSSGSEEMSGGAEISESGDSEEAEAEDDSGLGAEGEGAAEFDKMVNEEDVSEENAEAAMLAMMEESDSAEGDSLDEFPDLSGIKMEQPEAHPAEFQQLSPTPSETDSHRNIDILLDVKMPVSIELGRTSMAISDLLTLGPGSVVELNKLAGEPVDLLVNNAVVAKGEVVVVDENFGVRITLLMSPEERLKSLAQQ
ncbi:MAG: flagellar motor switch protein FliN [candidate division Zixibacteria bacterium]